MTLTMDKLIRSKDRSEKDSGAAASTRFAYDPKGNTHCFQGPKKDADGNVLVPGASVAWWTEQMRNRNGGFDGILPEFDPNPLRLLEGAGGRFKVSRALCGSQLPDGTFIANNPRSYNLMREDNQRILQTGVSADYSVKPYEEIVVIPDDIVLTAKDFGKENNAVLDELQLLYPNEDVRSENIEIPVNKLMTPWSCSVWLEGAKVTYQFLLGEVSIKGDKYKKFLTIRSCFDGSKSTEYFITLVRVVCENTEFHADVEGWQSLMGYEKTRARIRRNGRQMDEKIHNWHQTMGNAIFALAEIQQVFTKLASTKLAEGIAEREKAVKAFVMESFNLKEEGKTKRTENRTADVLEAVYNRDFGGGQCETLLDLWHGMTFVKQHNDQVNGLKTEAEREEKRYMNMLLVDADVKQSQQIFQRIVQLASVAA